MTSSVHPVDISIFAVFLAITLVVGLSYGRQVRTIQDYALGGKNFSTSTLVATIVATWYGGGFLFYTLANTYSKGLYYIIVVIGAAAPLLLIGQFLAVRMGEFLNNVSIAEAMGKLYGKRVQMITAVSSVLAATGWLAVQFKVISKMLTLLIGAEGVFINTIAAMTIIVYSALGGIRAVTFTDVIQFLTFGTFIPLLALIIWNNLQDPTKVIHTLTTNPIFDVKELIGWNTPFIASLALTLYFMIPNFYPAMFQRVALSSNVRQVRRSFTHAAGIVLLVNLFVVWIAILLLAHQPGLPPDGLVNYIINEYTYVGFKGLIVTGIVAMAMSTADSILNASSVLFANDLAQPLGISVKRPIITARIFSLVLGVLALLLATHTQNLLDLLLVADSFYMPTVTVPLLLAILGFRSSTKATLIGITFGFLTVLLWLSFLSHTGINSVIPGISASLIGLLGSHYLLREPGGWQKVAPNSPLGLERAARKKAWERRLKAIKTFKLYPYLQKNLPKQEGFYSLFGFYTIAATYTAFYTIGDSAVKAYQDIYEGIYHTVLFAITAFLTFPIWPPTVKSYRFITFFWPIGMGAILFFAGTLLVIMSHFHAVQVMILMINLLIAVLLLHWPLALTLAFSGIVLAIVFFKHYTGAALPSSALDSLQFKVMYGLLLFTSFLIALFKGKQAYRRLENHNEQLRAERAASSEELFEAIHHRERLAQAVSMDKVEALATINQMRKQLNDRLKQAKTKTQLAAVNKDFQETSEKLQVLTDYLSQVLQQTQDYMRLAVSTVSLQELLQDIFEILDKQNVTPSSQVLIQKHTQQQELQVDVHKIRQLLVDSLHYAQQHKQGDRPILLGIEDTTLGYPITSIQGHVKEVEALCFTITTESALPALRALYMGSVDRADIRLPQSAAELPITHNQQIVEAHYGASELIESEEAMTQIYVIPLHVREVRPKTMDLLPREAVKPDTTVYPEEKAFVKAVADKTAIDSERLEKAIQLIKQYHAGVKRKSGEPFYLHPIAVAHILLDYTKDQDTILAALLHDTVEDTRLSLTQVALMFNTAVQKIVDGVTHLDSNWKRIQLSGHENIQQLLEIKDERILYVKLADRLHNMRTIEGHPSLAKQQKIAEETLQFFVPIAKSLGLKPIAEELKKLSAAVLSKKKCTR